MVLGYREVGAIHCLLTGSVTVGKCRLLSTIFIPTKIFKALRRIVVARKAYKRKILRDVFSGFTLN